MSTVSAAAETVFVSVRMMEGRAMSQSVVSAAQNKSKASTPRYLAIYGRKRRIRVLFLGRGLVAASDMGTSFV